MSLLNTDQKREKRTSGTNAHHCRDYGRAQGFKGTFLIEPKPMEPTKHQYDVDTETVIGFLKAHGLERDFKVNIEVNHATLAGHTFEHELAVAVDNGMLGSIDANRGDYQNGWDTDQFPIDNFELTQAMMQIIRNDGLGNGGTNFDAKTRRNSTDPEDIFIAHLPEWTRWHVLWKAQPICSMNLLTGRCCPNAMPRSIQVKGKSLKKVKCLWMNLLLMQNPMVSRNKPVVNKSCMSAR